MAKLLTSGAALIRNAFNKFAPKFDIEAVEVVCAAIIAHLGDGVPVWICLIGAPGSGKTMVFNMLPCINLPGTNDPIIRDGAIISVDGLTPKSLISGFRDINRAGLLERIESGVLCIKDLAQFLTAPSGARPVFAQLRRIYDGESALPFGSGKTFRWKGRLTLVCASVRHLWSLDSELGARLLVLKLRPTIFSPALTDEKNRKDLSIAIKSALDMPRAKAGPKIGPKTANRMYSYAEAIAAARAYVRHDRKNWDITDEPIEEQPHRITNQLAALAESLCILRACPLDDVLPTILRVTVDTIPPMRRAILGAIADSVFHGKQGLVIDDLVDAMRKRAGWQITEMTVRHHLGDLVLLRLLDDDATVPGGGPGQPSKLIGPGTRWNLFERAPGLLDALRQ